MMPRKRAPADAAQRVEALAADGFSVVGIAHALRTTKEVMHRWFDEDASLKEAFDRGRADAEQKIYNVLFRAAMEDKNITAAIYLSKAMFGWRDQGEPATRALDRIHITFQLPGAMSMKDFQVIEHATTDDRDNRLPAASTAVTRTG